ncbi:MAG: NADH-quinone oxidoreductase subunit M, partial [Pedobacter sp.]
MEQLLLLIFLPLAGAIITAFAGKSAKIVSTVISVVSLGLALFIACNFIPNASTQFEANLPWIADLGIRFHAG